MAKRTVGKAAPAYGTGRSASLKTGHPLAGKDGYVYEHRLAIWEAGIDPRGWQVHHKDGYTTNNSLANLSLESPSGHQAHHSVPGALRKNQLGTRSGVRSWRSPVRLVLGKYQRAAAECQVVQRALS